MEKYEELKKVIQAANPEIMELKFGCEVKNKFTSVDYDAPNIYIEKEAMQYHVYRPSFEYSTYLNRDSVTIIGRPIRLADVLHTIDISSENRRTNFLEPLFGKICLEKWLLLDDDLDNQSDQTKQFLINLLVK